ncbi:MAG: hypothetical protein AAF581_17390 [Planctomycetota bacterium]
MRFAHFNCNVEPDIAVFRELDRESRPRGLPVFLQDDPTGFVAQLFIGEQWVRFPWLRPRQLEEASFGLDSVVMHADGQMDEIQSRLDNSGIRTDQRQLTVGDMGGRSQSQPEIDKILADLETDTEELLPPDIRDRMRKQMRESMSSFETQKLPVMNLDFPTPCRPHFRVKDDLGFPTATPERENSSALGVFGVSAVELTVPAEHLEMLIWLWRNLADDRIERTDQAATVDLGDHTLTLVSSAEPGEVRARLHAWTPFSSLAGSRFRVADIEIVTEHDVNPSPFGLRVPWPGSNEPHAARLVALDEKSFRVVAGDTTGRLPVPFGSVVELGLDRGSVVVTRIVEESRWITANMHLYEQTVDQAAVDSIGQAVLAAGGTFHQKAEFGQQSILLHYLPGSRPDPVEALRRLGFHRTH